MEALRARWHELLECFTDRERAEVLWRELKKRYTGSARHYHNLEHLHFMITRSEEIKTSLRDPEMVVFAIYYHDLVYNVLRKDNEVRSARIARSRLEELGIPEDRIAHCVAMIEATKDHPLSEDQDTNYLLDLDMAILGVSPERYLLYTEQVREEYAIYPDMLYNKGRKHVLQQFFADEHLFRTDVFKVEFEAKASRNIQSELARLN